MELCLVYNSLIYIKLAMYPEEWQARGEIGNEKRLVVYGIMKNQVHSIALLICSWEYVYVQPLTYGPQGGICKIIWAYIKLSYSGHYCSALWKFIFPKLLH